MILTFVGGLVILRTTHAIWEMDSPNAVAVNCTLNTVFGLNPMLEVIVLITVIMIIACFLTGFTRAGFG